MINQTPKSMFPVFLRRKEVQARTGLSAGSLYRLMGEGEFPLSVNLGGRMVAWVSSEVDSWLSDRLEQRNKASTAPNPQNEAIQNVEVIA